MASYYGHKEIVSLLLEKGADINAAGGFYGSALQVVAAWGHTEIVDILLKNGADVNAAGGHYGSALQAAAAEGHIEIVSILLAKGADINAAGGEYGSALQAAAAGGHTEIVDILFKKGADVVAAGGYFGSALQAAAAGGHTDIVNTLLAKVADVNAAGGKYGSALQAAAAFGHGKIVDILLQKGADGNATGGKYGSALQAAAAKGHTETVDILLERGADINAAGGKYGSALQAAITEGYPQIVSILCEKRAQLPVPTEMHNMTPPNDTSVFIGFATLPSSSSTTLAPSTSSFSLCLSFLFHILHIYRPTAEPAEAEEPLAWTFLAPGSPPLPSRAALVAEKTCKMICYLWFAPSMLGASSTSTSSAGLSPSGVDVMYWGLKENSGRDDALRPVVQLYTEAIQDEQGRRVLYTRVLFLKVFMRRARIWLGTIKES
ncbi:ankyrin repeat-containing domain protein [Mycena metata]|uniref:Ankyrin repeat-containing domain protein n=1 Tax=Mycena metata TaxID=1033252 RepID=A0AAD7IFR8_9AGAR|nr:ankyrin repeat-containing domain protein [Mycena metata]